MIDDRDIASTRRLRSIIISTGKSCRTGIAGFLFFVLAIWSCGSRRLPGSFSQHRINDIYADWVYDLSGSESSGGGDPFKLFDEAADPERDPGFSPVTNPIPNRNPSIFFKRNKGLRIVTDLQAGYHFESFYIYDAGGRGDSLWIYTGTMTDWKLVAALRTGKKGWIKLPCDDYAALVMVRLNSPLAIVNELVMYGQPDGNIPSPPVFQQGISISRPVTLGRFAGVNSFETAPLDVMEPFGDTRMYQNLSWYDADTVHAYPDNEVTLNYFQRPPSIQFPAYIDSLRKKYNAQLWFTLQGPPHYLERLSKPFNSRPTDQEGLDPEDPFSYHRHANIFWTLAAAYGAVRVDTGSMKIADVPKYSGLGLLNRFENGNENDESWDSLYWTPTEYFAISSADLDGHAGTMGPRLGLMQADPSSRLMTSGMIELDTARVKTLAFLCRSMRPDRKFVWQGGIQYHHYSNDGQLHTPTRPFSPDADHMREKLAQALTATRRVAPGVPVTIGENGYDRKQTSWQHTPLIPGHDEATSQGIMVIRSLMAAFMSGVDGYNYFMLRNATGDDDALGTFATSGMINGAGNIRYPVWFYWKNVVQALTDFEPDGVVSESGFTWIYRLRNRKDPREFCYYFVSPNTDEQRLINLNFKSALFHGQSVEQLNWQRNERYNWEDIAAKTDALKLQVGPVPVFIKVHK